MPIQYRHSSLATAGHERVEFSLEEFKQGIELHGYYARWAKASMCPNRDPLQDDHHRIDCDLCDRNGYIYYDPIEIRTHVTSFGEKQLFMPESRYDPGTAYFTTLPEHKISFWDKIEILTARARFTQVVKVKNKTYKLKYPALSIYHIVTSKNVQIPPETVLVEADGRVTFSAIPPGDFFSICYLYHPTYIIIDMLHHVRDSRNTVLTVDQELEYPMQAAGRLDFLVRDESKE